jgi:hypothetical protein
MSKSLSYSYVRGTNIFSYYGLEQVRQYKAFTDSDCLTISELLTSGLGMARLLDLADEAGMYDELKQFCNRCVVLVENLQASRQEPFCKDELKQMSAGRTIAAWTDKDILMMRPSVQGFRAQRSRSMVNQVVKFGVPYAAVVAEFIAAFN